MMRMLGILLLLLMPGLARAAESAPFVTARDTVSLVSRTDSAAPGQTLRLGLRFKLAPGWHTYWSNPGDAGAPPTIEATGARAGPLEFPLPERLRDGPFTSFAYTGDILLPFDATPEPGPARPIEVHANWLVCATVCVPEEARLTLNLPAGNGAAGAQAPLFTATEARLPRPSPWPARLAGGGVLWLAAPHLSLRNALFFPADAGVIDQGAPQVLHVRNDRVELTLKPLHPGLRSLTGILALTDTGGQVQALSVQAMPMDLPTGTGPAETGLMEAVLLAFAGGLILNLMPCVLPVLAMKALSLARLSGAERGHARREAAEYTLGVVLAFCAIGGAMLGARAAGGAAGWGTQFQSAAFTAGMALLLFAIGLNFSGVFMVGNRLAGMGQGLAARGSFFTGLLAVLVATPCTAPFMGAALAAALAMPAAAGMLVFVALGLGLATPFAVLAITPGAARLLPRPGAWMDTLKQILAFPMYGAALWMLWVTSQQTDPLGLAAAMGACLLVGFAAWAYGRAQLRERAGALGWAAAASLAGVCVLLIRLGGSSAAATPQAAAAADGSQPYSATRLSALLAAHRPVFIDMSAAWCVTCLVNERLALNPPDIRAAFARRGVVYPQGRLDAPRRRHLGLPARPRPLRRAALRLLRSRRHAQNIAADPHSRAGPADSGVVPLSKNGGRDAAAVEFGRDWPIPACPLVAA